MCTCLKLKQKQCYFGRTLDMSFHNKEQVVITPRNYKLNLKNGDVLTIKYAMIGTAININGYPLYYEACNELGLAIAGLNFPGNAKYNDPISNKINIAVFELIPFILGKYKTVKELKDDLNNFNITNINFSENFVSTPLHWMISDKDESIVLEQTESGLHIYQNDYDVMTNNPPFDLQIENVKKYLSLSNEFKKANDDRFNCVGLNGVGLPGDFSSMSRFTKTYFLGKYSHKYENEEESVAQYFHILDNVSMVKGSVLDATLKEDATFYTSCINMNEGIYYYKTYDNNQISAVKLNDENMNLKELTVIDLSYKQNINYLN